MTSLLQRMREHAACERAARKSVEWLEREGLLWNLRGMTPRMSAQDQLTTWRIWNEWREHQDTRVVNWKLVEHLLRKYGGWRDRRV